MSSIQSRIIGGRRVEIGSKAEAKYLAQGLTPETTGASSSRQNRATRGYDTTPLSTPSLPQSITSGDLSSTDTPFNLPQSRPTQSLGANLLGQIESQNDSFTADLSAKTKLQESERDKSLKDYISSLADDKGENTRTSEKYAQEVDPVETELKDINQKILSEKVGLQRQIEQIEKNTGGMLTSGVQQEVNRAQTESLRRQADLSITQMAIQGRYDSAKQIADRAVAAELEQQKQENDILKTIYEDNKDKFTTAEQRQFETMQKDRDRTLNQLEADKKTLSATKISIMQSAQQNGAPPSIALAIQQATTPEEAVAAAGQWLQSPDTQLNLQIKQQQLANLRLDNQKLTNELNPSGDPSISQDLEAYGSQYADTGKLPSVAELKLSGLSVGQVTSYAKQLPKPNGALVSLSTGSKSSALSPAQEDGILALYDISQKVGQLKELEAQRIKGLTSATLGKIFGSTAQENYINLRTEIIDLLARARTGAALTVQEEKFYTDQLPGRIGQVAFGLLGANTQNKINNFGTKIQGTLNTKLKGQGMGIYGFSKVKVGGIDRTIGEVIDIGGQQYRVLPDGTLTDII